MRTKDHVEDWQIRKQLLFGDQRTLIFTKSDTFLPVLWLIAVSLTLILV